MENITDTLRAMEASRAAGTSRVNETSRADEVSRTNEVSRTDRVSRTPNTQERLLKQELKNLKAVSKKEQEGASSKQEGGRR